MRTFQLHFNWTINEVFILAGSMDSSCHLHNSVITSRTQLYNSEKPITSTTLDRKCFYISPLNDHLITNTTNMLFYEV